MRLIQGEIGAFTLYDMAYGLSRICRWGGQTKTWFSVAEHSLWVAEIAGINGLFHDCAEMFLGDLPSPWKKMLPEYRMLESRLKSQIYEQLGLAPDGPSVKKADLEIREFELTLVKHSYPERDKDEVVRQFLKVGHDFRKICVNLKCPSGAEIATEPVVRVAS